jgi:hypothetical protein
VAKLRWTWRSAAFVGFAAAAAAGCGSHKGGAGATAAGSIDASASASAASVVDAGLGEAPGANAPPLAPAQAAPRLGLGDVRLVSLGWDPRVPRPDDAELRKRLDAAMAKASLLPAGAGADSVPAKLEFSSGLGFQGDPGKETRVDAAVSLRLRWKEDGATRSMESRVLGQLPVAAADRAHLGDKASAALERALADAAASLALRDGIRRGDEPTVIAALTHEDTDVRAEAFRAVGLRHLNGALPRLTELLRSPDHEIRDAAIGALVELGDRRAVKPLVDLVEFSDLDMMRRIIDAVGMLGGDEARDYLEFVASGHETPAVRELAAQALDRLKRREQKTPSSAAPAPPSSAPSASPPADK